MALLNTRENSQSGDRKRQRMKRQLIPLKELMGISTPGKHIQGRSSCFHSQLDDGTEGQLCHPSTKLPLVQPLQTHWASSELQGELDQVWAVNQQLNVA